MDRPRGYGAGGASSRPVSGEGSRSLGGRRQQGTLAGRFVRREWESSSTDWWMRAGMVGQLPALRSGGKRQDAQSGQGWASQGQRRGKCGVRRQAERVSRPARERNRRRRVLVVTTCSPRPMRAVQRARLCAITCTASQAALAAKRPDGRWLRPTPYLRSRMAFSISAWRRWSASRSRVSPSRSVMKA